MYIIIDINCLASVFNEKTADHQNFKALKIWIMSSKGKVVFGGTTYKNELKKCHTYLKLIQELFKINKAIKIDTECVDINEAIVVQRAIDNNLAKIKQDFDDPHLIALVNTSKSEIICTKEERAVDFIKSQCLYDKGIRRPKIYSQFKNKNLLK